MSWLVRQLKDAPATLRLESHAAPARGPGAAELLRGVREDANLLIGDPTKELRSFRVALTSGMGAKRGRGRGSFVDSVLDAIDTFHGEAAENLKAWSAKPPKLWSETEAAGEDDGSRASLTWTAISSQDEELKPRLEPSATDSAWTSVSRFSLRVTPAVSTLVSWISTSDGSHSGNGVTSLPYLAVPGATSDQALQLDHRDHLVVNGRLQRRSARSTGAAVL